VSAAEPVVTRAFGTLGAGLIADAAGASGSPGPSATLANKRIAVSTIPTVVK
jgi:hypothetical protein